MQVLGKKGTSGIEPKAFRKFVMIGWGPLSERTWVPARFAGEVCKERWNSGRLGEPAPPMNESADEFFQKALGLSRNFFNGG